MATVVTQPAIFPAFLNFTQIGVCSSPLIPIFTEPFFTRYPPPQDELAAAESVTIELAEAISIKALETLFSWYKFIQFDGFPNFRFKKISVIESVPELIPSETITIIFLGVLLE